VTSRERVVRAIDHKPVDRAPIDLGMMFASGISAFAYWRLREHLGLSTDRVELVSPVWFLARVDEDVLQRFHCDAILLAPPRESRRTWRPRPPYSFEMAAQVQATGDGQGGWVLSEGSGRAVMPAGGQELFIREGWSPYFDGMIGEAYLEEEAREAERIFKETDYATFYQSIGAYFMQGVAEWLCRLALDPADVMAENERQLEKDLWHAGRVIDRMGRYVQGICIGADLGTQGGPLADPRAYERWIMPTVKKLCAFIKANSDFRIFYHGCGAIRPFIPMLIECGVDVLNPVQISARGMDPRELKREFGDRICFWGGGCDTQNVLGRASPEEVRDHVREMVRIFKPGSGFVFNQVQDIMADVPPGNVVAMLDTAYEESFYA
jgi:uroporphyrinogen decarboxylase